jgi:hypothetical protein
MRGEKVETIALPIILFYFKVPLSDSLQQFRGSQIYVRNELVNLLVLFPKNSLDPSKMQKLKRIRCMQAYNFGEGVTVRNLA